MTQKSMKTWKALDNFGSKTERLKLPNVNTKRKLMTKRSSIETDNAKGNVIKTKEKYKGEKNENKTNTLEKTHEEDKKKDSVGMNATANLNIKKGILKNTAEESHKEILEDKEKNNEDYTEALCDDSINDDN